jgi:hypothetical protein
MTDYDPLLASSVKALSAKFSIPQYVLRHWQIQGYIDRCQITPEEWQILSFVQRAVWPSILVARALLATLPKKARGKLVRGCEKTAVERAVFFDLLRAKLLGQGLPGSGKARITYSEYAEYLSWRRPSLRQKLTRQIFVNQRKAALATIAYAQKRGQVSRLVEELRIEYIDHGST